MNITNKTKMSNKGLERTRLVTWTVAILLILSLSTNTAKSAGPWFVAPGGSDTNDCLAPAHPCETIQAAIGKAISGGLIKVASGVYLAAGSQVLLIDKSISISGGWDNLFVNQIGHSTIDGQYSRKGIYTTAPSSVHIFIDHFLIRGSVVPGGIVIDNGAQMTLSDSQVSDNAALAITNMGTITVTKTIITDNLGGISGLGGKFLITDSEIRENTGAGISILNSSVRVQNTLIQKNSGGGIFAPISDVLLDHSAVVDNVLMQYSIAAAGSYTEIGFLVLDESIVSNNRGIGSVGGIFTKNSEVYINSSTVSGNHTTLSDLDPPGGLPGGIYNETGTVSLKNTILANNSSIYGTPDCIGSISSSGNNLIGDTTGCSFTSSAGDLLNLDPHIYRMGNYNALSSDSPAIDGGDPAGCTDRQGNLFVTDQRGAPRYVDGNGDLNSICDIGAYEFDPSAPIYDIFLPINRVSCEADICAHAIINGKPAAYISSNSNPAP